MDFPHKKFLQLLKEKESNLEQSLVETNLKLVYSQKNKIRNFIEKLELIDKLDSDILEIESMIEEKIGEFEYEIREEINKLTLEKEEKKEEFKKDLLKNEIANTTGIFAEFQAGAGGDESALFAWELFSMYIKYASYKNWKTEIIEINSIEKEKLKSGILNIKGRDVYELLHNESGVHRVQRIPVTESSGRIHTSTVAITILPELEDIVVKIDEKDIRLDLFCASGAGGQHVNKTESAVRLTHIPTGIVVQCQDERSQHENKRRAMRVLTARINELESRKIKEERLKEKQQQVKTLERNEKIRTYNFHRNSVDDHRYGVISHRIKEFLVGEEELDKFLINLKKSEIKTKLEDVNYILSLFENL